MQKSLNDAASVQSLFDEMFALGVSAKGEPIMKQSYDSTTFMPNPMFQVDPMDVIRLFYGRISQALLSGKDNTALNGCLARLQQCEQQLTATNSLDRSLQVMSIDALASLNKLVDDVQMALRANILDDKTWGNRVPEELLMKDMLGGLKLADVENELKFMVRGKSYLKDSKKVWYCLMLRFGINE